MGMLERLKSTFFRVGIDEIINYCLFMSSRHSLKSNLFSIDTWSNTKANFPKSLQEPRPNLYGWRIDLGENCFEAQKRIKVVWLSSKETWVKLKVTTNNETKGPRLIIQLNILITYLISSRQILIDNYVFKMKIFSADSELSNSEEIKKISGKFKSIYQLILVIRYYHFKDTHFRVNQVFKIHSMYLINNDCFQFYCFAAGMVSSCWKQSLLDQIQQLNKREEYIIFMVPVLNCQSRKTVQNFISSKESMKDRNYRGLTCEALHKSHFSKMQSTTY